MPAAPAVVVLEDLHWADAMAVWVLEHLPRALGDARVAFVATSRDAEPDMPRLDTDQRRRRCGRAAAHRLHRREPLLRRRQRAASSPPPTISSPGCRPSPAARYSTPSTSGSGRPASVQRSLTNPSRGTGTASTGGAGDPDVIHLPRRRDSGLQLVHGVSTPPTRDARGVDHPARLPPRQQADTPTPSRCRSWTRSTSAVTAGARPDSHAGRRRARNLLTPQALTPTSQSMPGAAADQVAAAARDAYVGGPCPTAGYHPQPAEQRVLDVT